MPFFRKKRPSTLVTDNLKANGSQNTLSLLDQQNSFLSNKPLSNFKASPELLASSSCKSKLNSLPFLEDLSPLVKEYFSAYLKNEGLDEVLSLWEVLNKLENRIKSDEADESSIINEEIRLAKIHTEKTILQLNLTLLNEEYEEDPCAWITKTNNQLKQFLQDEYLNKYFESKYHIKCQVDFFTNNADVTLHEIISNQNALFYFMEYVDQESKRGVLEFWLGATNFAEQFIKTDTKDENFDLKLAQSDAMVLYEKYISLQATQPLGIRDQIRSEVERLICSPTLEEIAHCFDAAIAEIFCFLHVTCLEGFLKSSLFLAFLSDLINSMSAPSKTHKRSESTSTCSSSSASLTSPIANPKASQNHGQNKTKLSLGRVNSLGKFEADTDLEILKHESGLTKTVKKLVNYDEKEKAKEDLAWQVAAMIVNEVTSITMGNGETNSLNQ